MITCNNSSMIVGFLFDVYQGDCSLKCGAAGLQGSRGVCGEARRGCEERYVELSASLGCDYRVSTAIYVERFFCQAQGRLGGRQALELFCFAGFFF